MDETKKCRSCKMEIAIDAKKCPHCRSVQNWLHSPAVLTIGVCAFYLLLFIMIGLMFTELFSDIYDEGESFADYPDALKVCSSELKFGEGDCGPTVVILGKLCNKSKVNWRDIHFEVKCYNSQDELIDAAQDYDYSLIAPAESSVSFKVSFVREFPQADYITHEVRIIHAEDADN